MGELVLRAATAEDTRAIGEALAGLLRPRDAVVLTGELGAGKTTLVRGIARGLGVEEHVASPTFTLVREYAGRLAVAHVDVYRLERVQDVVDLALDEVADGEAVLLVEWGDAVAELLPADRLRIELTSAGGGPRPGAGADGAAADEPRRIAIDAVGPSWAERWAALASALGPWREAA
ncbi:MAG TPA: tRNA (adenosine(37)-N6)-threonylcarbamoyltransferase complex ATPase subunit type 1 TsaE [Actinomycetota bacterium]